MIKVGIIGATGYAGNELVRLLLGHKDAEIVWLGSRSYIDQNYSDVYRNMFKLVDAKCLPLSGRLRRPNSLPLRLATSWWM